MPDLNFLTVNPVTAGIESAQRMEAQRQRGELVDLQVQDARAKRAQEQSASQALNDIYAQGGDLSSADVHRRLAADPRVGGTRRLEALQVAEDLANKKTQADGQARERDARQFKMLLENGMDGAAAEVAKRMGMNIPPDFWTNQAKRRALLEKLEIEDKQAGINQKRASAGASQALAESRRPDPYTEYVDNEGRLVRVDRATGRSSFVMGPDNQPLRQQTKDSTRLTGIQDTNAARIKIAELQARARSEQGDARNRTLREIADLQAQSREAVAAGRGASDMGREQLRQEGANARAETTAQSREAVEAGRGAAALNRTEVQQEGANARTQTNAQSREAVAAGNQSTRLQVEEQKGGREGGRGGRPLDREVRLRMLQEAGVPDDEARRIAAGVSMTPQQIAGFRDRAMKRVQTPDPTTGRLQFRTPAEQDAEVERQVQIVTGGAAQTGARNAPAPAAAGGTPMRNGMAAPRTPEERDALPPGTRYLDPNGNIRVRR